MPHDRWGVPKRQLGVSIRSSGCCALGLVWRQRPWWRRCAVPACSARRSAAGSSPVHSRSRSRFALQSASSPSRRHAPPVAWSVRGLVLCSTSARSRRSLAGAACRRLPLLDVRFLARQVVFDELAPLRMVQCFFVLRHPTVELVVGVYVSGRLQQAVRSWRIGIPSDNHATERSLRRSATSLKFSVGTRSLL